ncbi:MAG: alpha-amylase family glycosyl hydrolase [Schleiferiaceae bacterium]|jgi:glycosidase|nr:alpha-amylase family glycosyl hydrolase [Schleiferiaceae bacterium]
MKSIIGKTLLGLSIAALASCGGPDAEKQEETAVEIKVESRVPEWAKSANIYEVNVRQYTPEGTLNAFAKDLPRLAEMGVDILWFMPIQPIGVKNRKESEEDYGSFYSIKNYTEVNPDLGTMEDFKVIVDKAHDLGMYVVLDWVANHSAWDHEWTISNPEFYTSDSTGASPIVPIDNEGGATDWTDVADLNYDNSEMRQAMVDEMKFWLTETGIDGFRCDVAGFVPNDFWYDAVPQLKEIKDDIFMLAEWEDPAHMKVFNMNYGWHMHHVMNHVAKGDTSAKAFEVYAEINDSLYGDDDIRMFFITNHDENSWNGTVKERMGEAGETYFVLATTFGKGMPLIYSGQEMGLDHRLSFFGKDTIKWHKPEMVEFYKKSLALKHKNPALWNGKYGAPMQMGEADNDNVLVYARELNGNEVVVFINFSDAPQNFNYKTIAAGEYSEWYSGVKQNLTESGAMELGGFEYKVFTKNNL